MKLGLQRRNTNDCAIHRSSCIKYQECMYSERLSSSSSFQKFDKTQTVTTVSHVSRMLCYDGIVSLPLLPDPSDLSELLTSSTCEAEQGICFSALTQSQGLRVATFGCWPRQSGDSLAWYGVPECKHEVSSTDFFLAPTRTLETCNFQSCVEGVLHVSKEPYKPLKGSRA